MKIAIIGPEQDDCLEYHLKSTLEEMGHTAQTFQLSEVFPFLRNQFLSRAYQYIAYLRQEMVKKHHRSLAQKILDFSPDLIIGTDRAVHSECVNYLKDNRPSLPAVHINPDQLTTLGRQHIFLARYDAYFTKDKFILAFMKDKLSLRTYYLPECFNPAFHTMDQWPTKEQAEEKIGIDVMTMGGIYPYRGLFLEQLLDAGINLSIYGRSFDYYPGKWQKAFQNEYITGTRKAELIYGAKIVLNNMHYAEIEAVNCKFFEIMGMGGCQLCDDKPVLTELAKPDKEVVTFRSTDECIGKIKYLLAHPKIRHDIAKRARQRALSEHTYHHRLNELFSKIEDLLN